MTERNNAMEWELLHSLEDLMSDTFREHWFYRWSRLFKNTDAAHIPVREKECEHIMHRSMQYRQEKEEYEVLQWN